MREATTMRAVMISWVALGVCLSACATPQNIKDKSAANVALYSDLASAHRTYVSAMREELTRRDLLEAEVAVRLGQSQADLQNPLPVPTLTQQVVQSLRLLGLQIDASRLAYGVVDRFLRIDVVDVADVSTASSRLDDALKEK